MGKQSTNMKNNNQQIWKKKINRYEKKRSTNIYI